MALPGLEEEIDDEEEIGPPEGGAAESLGMPMEGMGGMRDDFTAAAEEAFPDMAGQPERVSALKDLVRICLEEDQAGGYGDEKTKEKPKGGLALIFGSPKKK
jgi:hypothetical protein